MNFLNLPLSRMVFEGQPLILLNLTLTSLLNTDLRRSIVTKKFAGVAIVCIWIYSVLYSMITIALPQSSYQYNDYSGYCMEQWYYNSNYGELAQVNPASSARNQNQKCLNFTNTLGPHGVFA